MAKKSKNLYSFWRNSPTWQTDRHRMPAIAALMQICIASHGNNRTSASCLAKLISKYYGDRMKSLDAFSWDHTTCAAAVGRLSADPSSICARENEHLVWINTPDDSGVSKSSHYSVLVIGKQVGATKHCHRHKSSQIESNRFFSKWKLTNVIVHDNDTQTKGAK